MTIAKIQTLHRVSAILSSLICVFTGFAQNSLSERLSHVLELQDFDMGMQLYGEITPTDLTELPDSSLFDYHYLGGYLNSKIPNHEKAISHLLTAKNLCDTKLGSYSIGYMEIMQCLGDEYFKLDRVDEALATYQEGIVRTTAIREAAPKSFANLIMGVQYCYEKLGWFNEVPNHIMDAWVFWPKDETPLQTYTYYPLWLLEQFFSRYGYYDEALSVSAQIEEFIVSREGNNSPELCQSLYMKGNILGKAKRNDEAAMQYKRAINIAASHDIKDTKILGLIYGNLLITLASLDRIEECDNLLQDIQSYGQKNGNGSIYKNALFSIAKIFHENNNFTKALEYNSRLLSQTLTEQERNAIERQANTIRINQEAIESFPQLEIKFNSLVIGSDEWFATAHNLSNAYYLKQDKDKNHDILIKMYNELHNNNSLGDDYYFWVISNIFSNAMEREKYDEALKYAAEKFEYIESESDLPESYHYFARNDLAVAKIKANRLDGIDKDLEYIEQFCVALYGESSSEYAIYLHNRGRAYQLQNKLEDAKTTLLRSISLQNKVDGRPMENTYRYYTEVVQQLGEL